LLLSDALPYIILKETSNLSQDEKFFFLSLSLQKDSTIDTISLFGFRHLFKTSPIIDIECVLVMKSTSEGFDFQS